MTNGLFRQTGNVAVTDFDISDQTFEENTQNQEPPVLEVSDSMTQEQGQDTIVEGPTASPEDNKPTDTTIQVSEPPTQVQVQAEVTEDNVFNFLSEKLGREIKSISDLQPTVKDPLEEDTYLKQLVEWRKTTGRPIEDWVKYQKNYSELSDLEIVRETLQHKFPMLTPDEIDMELGKYIPDEDMDTDSQIASKKIEMKKLAYEGRQLLEKLKLDLGSPTEGFGLSEEIKADLEIARQAKEAQAANSQNIQAYSQGITSAASSLDKISIKLTDDFSIDYIVSDQIKKDLPDFINTMPHWRNENGEMNYKAVVEDSLKIKHIDDIIKLVYEQGVNVGQDNILKKGNNINLNEPDKLKSPSNDAPVIEGLDKYLGRGVNKIRF